MDMESFQRLEIELECKPPAVPSMNVCIGLPYFNFQLGDRNGKRCAQSAMDGTDSTMA